LNTDTEWNVNGRIFHKKAHESNYSNSEYKIYKTADKNFCCNCQGWCAKKKRGEIPIGGAGCSHVLALFYAFKMKRFGKSNGAEDQHLIPDPLPGEAQSMEGGDDEICG
jgi:hypothetical protein